MTRTLVVLTVLVAATVGGSAAAAPAGAAADEEALVREALALRRRGDDAAALPILQRAYAIAHSPRAAAQLGFAEQALGQWPQAEAHVGEALRAEDDPWIAKHRAVVAESLSTIRAHVAQDRAHAARVQPPPVASAPPARAAGQPPPPRATSVPRPVFSRPPPEPVTLLTPPAQRRDGDDRPGHGRRRAGVAVAVGGFAAVGLGVASSLVGAQKFDAIKADALADRPYNEANGNWKTYDRAATVLYVAGAGAIVSGVLLYRSGNREEESAAVPSVRSVSLRPQLSPQRLGVTLAARF